MSSSPTGSNRRTVFFSFCHMTGCRPAKEGKTVRSKTDPFQYSRGEVIRLGCVVPVPSGDYCDFCAAETIFKLYRCRNFVFNNMPVFQNGSGTWAACKTCAALVNADRWSELAERSFIKFAKRHGPISRRDAIRLRDQFRTIHQLFREHKLIPS